jgi:ATP-dependent Clp protease ATP-binding subunit ClpA
MEMGSPSLFDHLVTRVVNTAASTDPLARLDAAVAVAGEAVDAGDRLLDHFVAQGRHAGLSWTDIGARLGVSKQAARQRFAERTQPLVLPGGAEPNSRLQACLDQAGAVAQADAAAEIDTHHLLAGLLAEGVAAAILERLGVTAEAILGSGHRLFGPPSGGPGEHVPPMSAEATCALDGAARHVVAASPDSPSPQVRTEHLLFVLALDAGGRARRVLNDLGTDIAAIKRELECYVTGKPRRRGSRWKRPGAAGRACSFCGRSEKVAGRLVAGPGVHICGGCVALGADILRREAA